MKDQINMMISEAIALIVSGILSKEELEEVRDLVEDMLDQYDEETKQLDKLMQKHELMKRLT